eukprot:1183352-Alexandrium_andersonii.AAC.1
MATRARPSNLRPRPRSAFPGTWDVVRAQQSMGAPGGTVPECRHCLEGEDVHEQEVPPRAG